MRLFSIHSLRFVLQGNSGHVTPLFLTALLLGALSSSGQAQNSKPVAQLPLVTIDTTWNPPTGGKTWAAHSATDFKNALGGSQPGDIIVLDAGVTYNAAAAGLGYFTLPAKSNPNNQWIYIMSSQLANLPAGTRVDPTMTQYMATIVTPGVAPALNVAAGANYYRIAGLELTAQSNYPKGCGVSGQPNCMTYFLMSTDEWPITTEADSITIDRCYVHGGPTQDLQGAIQGNWSNTALVDSYVSEVHIGGFEAAAFSAFHSPGPFLIRNNYLEASTQSIIFGGSGQNNNPWVPSDITITGNYLYKPLSWVPLSTGPKPAMVVKNHFEVKSGQRILFDSNVLENIWVAQQTGSSILLTVRTGQSGDIAVDNDITITNNVLKNVVRGISISAADDGCGASGGYPNCHNAGEEDRINIFNNLILFFDPTAPGGSTNYGFVIANSLDRIHMVMGMPKDMVFQHNTMIPPASYPNPNACKWSMFVTDQSPSGFAPAPHLTDNIWILDNVFCRQPSGDWGYMGMRGLNLYYPYPSTPPNDITQRFYGNVMWAQSDRVYSYPTGNTVPATITYVNPPTDYTLLSPNWTTTSDGKLAGIDNNNLPAGYAQLPDPLDP